ncbi:LMBR1-like membrane protein, partial [Dimargaris cristalligena]
MDSFPSPTQSPLPASSSPIASPTPTPTPVPTPPAIPPPSVFSVVPVILCFVATFGLVAILINYFGDRRKTRWYVQGIATLSWYLPFTIMFLLPLDLSSTLYRRCQQSETCRATGLGGGAPLMYLDERAQFIIWRVVYWTSFSLTWLSLPFLISFVDSGAFRVRDRVRSALRANLLYYSFAGLAALGFLGYFIFVKGITDGKALMAFVMAAANSWGLLLIIIFMGCGLVAVPRRLWHSANLEREFEQIEAKAVGLKDDWFIAEMDLYDLLAKTRVVEDRLPSGSPLRPLVQLILKKFPPASQRATTASIIRTGDSEELGLPDVFTEKFLEDLHLRVMRAQSKEARCRALWEQQLHTALFFQDVLHSAHNPDHRLESTIQPYRDASPLHKSTAWWWYVRIRPFLYRTFALVFTLLSVALIWSEVTFNFSNPPLSIFAHLLHSLPLSYASLEAISFLTMAYMCACAYMMLMKLKLFHFYALAPNHHTNERSLLFCGSYLCRLTTPLCYNFLTLSRETTNPVFAQFMGQIDLVPFLGDEFNDWMPILILIPALITYFRIHSRIFSWFDASDPLLTSDD